LPSSFDLPISSQITSMMTKPSITMPLRPTDNPGAICNPPNELRYRLGPFSFADVF
jgi:hypothetical protein